MARKYQELAMTPVVQEAQRHYYGRAQTFPAAANSDSTPLGPDEVAFIGTRDSFYMATVSETGWPYVQHRGGPTGFLRVTNPQTLAFADFHGNRQLLSTGNLAAGNDRVALFLMDYPQRTRLKILGHGRVLDAREEPALAKDLASNGKLLSKVERVFIIDVVSFDWNCPQYITPRYTEEEIETLIAGSLRARVRELEAQLSMASAEDVKDNGAKDLPEGLTTIPSTFGSKETLDRLETEIHARGMKVFARIDHAAGAAEAGLKLQPTDLILFGNARGGTPLMQSVQTVGIDLPLKALVWEDKEGKTWLSYNEPTWIAQRHSVASAEQVVSGMAAMVSAISRRAADTQ